MKMNIFVYLWKCILFKRFYWQAEEIEKIKREGDRIFKSFNIEK